MVRGVRVAIVLIVFIFSIFQAVLLMTESTHFQDKMQAMATQGVVAICINYPPNITGVCAGDINQSTAIVNNTFYCQMNATTVTFTDLNYSSNGTFNGTQISYGEIDFVINGLHFTLNKSGFITINSNQFGIGQYSVPIVVRDTSPCPLPSGYNYNFRIYDINDPPELTDTLPSKTVKPTVTIFPFFLSDYFIDVDGDAMTYTVSSSELSVLILNDTSQVAIAAAEGVCGVKNIYFTATDEHNLSTDSNVVSIDVNCATQTPTESSGGGGGGTCDPDWQCKEWSKCFINSSQYRTCVDLNACDYNNMKEDFWRDCVYTPTCYDGVKNQGESGIDCGGPCQACFIQKDDQKKNMTCEDGIKNQGELGIDCGGPCAACKQVEVPGLLPEEYSNKFLTIAMITVLFLTAMAVTYVIFRKEIKKFLAKFAWLLTRRRRKHILLKDSEREEILSSIKALELNMKKSDAVIKDSDKVFQDFLKLSKTYLDYAIKCKSFSEQDVEKALRIVKNRNLRKAMKIFTDRHVLMETSEIELDKALLTYYVQDLRQLVLNTSNYDKKDYSFVARAVSIEGTPLQKCKSLLYNATVALEFSDVDSAEKSYFELLKMYELLDEKGKEMVFYELSKLFNYISYVISWQ
jgi:hypothetical protein